MVSEARGEVTGREGRRRSGDEGPGGATGNTGTKVEEEQCLANKGEQAQVHDEQRHGERREGRWEWGAAR